MFGSCLTQVSLQLSKFMESLLQNAGKIRKLIKELREKYSKCETTPEKLEYLCACERT